jgi:hypothetical protein
MINKKSTETAYLLIHPPTPRLSHRFLSEDPAAAPFTAADRLHDASVLESIRAEATLGLGFGLDADLESEEDEDGGGEVERDHSRDSILDVDALKSALEDDEMGE